MAATRRKARTAITAVTKLLCLHILDGNIEPNDSMMCYTNPEVVYFTCTLKRAAGRGELATVGIHYPYGYTAERRGGMQHFNDVVPNFFERGHAPHRRPSIKGLMLWTLLTKTKASIFSLPDVLEAVVREYLRPCQLDNASVLMNERFGVAHPLSIVHKTEDAVTVRYGDDDTTATVALRGEPSRRRAQDPRLMYGDHNTTLDLVNRKCYYDADHSLDDEGILAIPIPRVVQHGGAAVSTDCEGLAFVLEQPFKPWS